jgi:sugar phosphate isomerase/epimerase
MIPVGVQLYSLRAELDQDFEGTLDAVAHFGYEGVELASLHGRSAGAFQQALAKRGLPVVAWHNSDILDPAKRPSVLAQAQELGCEQIVYPWHSPESFRTPNDIRVLADSLNKAAVDAAEQNITLLYHNHDFEFAQTSGQLGMSLLLEHLDPLVRLELDTYWVAVAGQDPKTTLARLAERVKLIHVKDGLLKPAAPMTAVGEGKLDYPSILSAPTPALAWLLVELDVCATDMKEAVRKSLAYLRAKGLAKS